MQRHFRATEGAAAVAATNRDTAGAVVAGRSVVAARRATQGAGDGAHAG